MWRTLQLITLGLLGAILGLSALSRRHPNIGWLQAFRFIRPELSEAEQARIRRRANRYAGIELILLGLGVPIVYTVSCVMMFNDPTPLGLTVSGAIGLLLIVLGSVVVGRNWRERRPRRDHTT